MKREYHHWFSPSLNRDMELLVFGYAGAQVLVFPTRQGRFSDYENWGLIGALSSSIEHGLLQVFCVDSVDSESLYCGSASPLARIARHKQYEQYLLQKAILFMRGSSQASFLMAHGCSIGAYHAVTLALRHPGLFGKVVALSRRYDLTKPVGPFIDLFDGYYDEDIYFYTPNHFLPQLEEPIALAALRRTKFILAVGEEDSFKDSTEQLSCYLSDKGILHTLAIWAGEAHRAHHWRQMVHLYF